MTTNEKLPLVSVILAVCNGESTLAPCLKSVQDQTVEEIEIICVDDGSSDRTGEILDAVAEIDARIRVLHQEKCGVSAARNAGLDIARGKYVTFIDADDEYTAMHLKLLVSKAEVERCDVVQIGHCEVTDGVVTRTSLPNEKCMATDLRANPDIIRLQTKYVWDKLYRREMIEANKIRFAPYGYHEDHLFLIDVDLVAKNFGTVPEVGYRYSKSSAGAATRAYDERLLDCPKAYADICRRLRKAGLFKETASAVWANCSMSYVWRVWAFRKYDDKRLQAEIVRGWYDFFEKNFPLWQKSLHLGGHPVVLPPGQPPKVLLLGGTGALGAHLRDILAEQGMDVWVTSRSDHEDTGNIHYLRGNAMERKFFDGLMASHWDVIVDFMVHGPIGFKTKLPTLLRQCGQYVFLSSSRAYADAGESLITEKSARIVDTATDSDYLKTNEYALAKGRAEDVLTACEQKNWTVIRPYVTFSEQRLQLGTLEKEHWLKRALDGKPIVFSEDIAEKTTTLTYGYDVARGMAAIIGRPEAYGQMYHITSPKSVRWKDVLALYVRVIEEVTGKKCPVVMTPHACQLKTSGRYQVLFDRLYNRRFDNSKIAKFIDPKTFREPMEALEACLKEFLKAPKFLAVNAELEALHDEACNPKAKALPKTMYTDERNVQILIAALKAHGIRQIVASPGTTNLTFVASCQYDGSFEMKSAPDERSAAYIACGWAAESGKPVVITCTGATASRNYLPGLTEAYYRKLPVLAVTGTLYENRSGHLTAQFVDRSCAPTDTVRLSVSMPLCRAKDDEWYNTIAANRAILELSRHGGGPVHINLETSHSHNYTVEKIAPIRVIRRYAAGDVLPEIPEGRVGVFVGAHVPWTKELTEAVEAFCVKYDAPVFCDHASNYRGGHELNFTLASYQQSKSSLRFRPDTMIHLGEVSGDYPSFRQVGTAKVWRVSADGEIRDQFRRLFNVFEMSELDFFRTYAKKKDEFPRKGYFSACQAHLETLRRHMPRLPFSNLWVAGQGAKTIPENSVIHFGILNSFRSWSIFPLPKSVLASCNTGGFGIDGCLSTVLGASFAAPQKVHYAVLGDLAFFYDMNSLGNRHVGPNLRILLINNGKGVEFRNFNHPAFQFGESADEFVAAGGHYGAKSPALVREYAKSLGFEYISASSKDEYLKRAAHFWDAKMHDKPMLFEVFTDSKDESDALESLTLIEGYAPTTSAKTTKPADVKPTPTSAQAPSKSVPAAPIKPSRKIAILTFHTAFNCGAQLQAWALQRVLRKLGFEPEFPDCTNIGFLTRFSRKRCKFDNTSFKTRLKSRWTKFLADFCSLGVEDKKRHRFRMFAKHCLNIVPATVEEVERKYSAVIVGSDQVWNSGITQKESSYYLTTAFKNSKLKRYSYAISVGDKVPPPARIPVLCNAAKLFENLSFRENMLPDLTDKYGRKPVIDPDPTLILPREEFKYAAFPKRLERKPYLLVYSLKYDEKLWATARAVARQRKLKPVIIQVYHYGRYKLVDSKNVHIDVSPDRFLAYYRDAEVVLTSTFHGTVFSIVYGKPFAVFPNFTGELPQRCVRLLTTLHEKARLIPSANDMNAVDRALAQPPKPETYEALDRLRNMTIRRLKTILPNVSDLPRTPKKPKPSLMAYPFVKAWGGVKCLRENGLVYTIKHIGGKVLRYMGVRSRL